MPKLQLTVPNPNGRQEGVERLKGFLVKIKERHGEQVKDLHEEWEGETLKFSFSTFGIKIQGTLAVDDSEVKFVGELPFAAMVFKGKIESEIRDTLTKVLA